MKCIYIYVIYVYQEMLHEPFMITNNLFRCYICVCIYWSNKKFANRSCLFCFFAYCRHRTRHKVWSFSSFKSILKVISRCWHLKTFRKQVFHQRQSKSSRTNFLGIKNKKNMNNLILSPFCLHNYVKLWKGIFVSGLRKE